MEAQRPDSLPEHFIYHRKHSSSRGGCPTILGAGAAAKAKRQSPASEADRSIEHRGAALELAVGALFIANGRPYQKAILTIIFFFRAVAMDSATEETLKNTSQRSSDLSR